MIPHFNSWKGCKRNKYKINVILYDIGYHSIVNTQTEYSWKLTTKFLTINYYCTVKLSKTEGRQLREQHSIKSCNYCVKASRLSVLIVNVLWREWRNSSFCCCSYVDNIHTAVLQVNQPININYTSSTLY